MDENRSAVAFALTPFRPHVLVVVAALTMANLGGCSSGAGSKNSDARIAPLAGTERLSDIAGVAVDGLGSVFVTDGRNLVQKIDKDGHMSTVAGGTGLGESLSAPSGLAVDGDGSLFIADTGNNRVRKRDDRGRITTVAEALPNPTALAVGAGNELYVADAQRIHRVDVDGSVTVVAGGGTEAATRRPQPATDVQVINPSALAARKGEVFAAIAATGQVLRIDRKGMLTIFAGDGRTDEWRRRNAGPAVDAMLLGPSGLATDDQGNLFVAEAGADQLSRIDKAGAIHEVVEISVGRERIRPVGPGFREASPLDEPGPLASGPGSRLFVVERGSNQLSVVTNASTGPLTVRVYPPTFAEPMVTSIRPASGGALGGTAVVIRGQGLDAYAKVRFGDEDAVVVQAYGKSLLALSPPGNTGSVVSVKVVKGHQSTAPSPSMRFRYVEGWGRAAPLSEPRQAHTSTLLDPPTCRGDVPASARGYPCGQVLVAGGYQSFCIGCYPVNSAELYDPAADRWRPTASMHGGRMEHTATLLPDGRVLSAGGKHAGTGDPEGPSALTSAELFDPAGPTWTRTGSMAQGRFAHTATLLDGPACRGAPRPTWCGKVLVVGGTTEELWRPPIASAELYDPGSGTWSSAGTLAHARANHSASLLPDGRVMVAGGFRPDPADPSHLQSTPTVEMYDPATNAWSTGAQMGTSRAAHTATSLEDGKILVVGGHSAGSTDVLKSAEVFDPQTNSWKVAGLVTDGRSGHTASLLPSGFVLVAGGGPIFEDPVVRIDSIASAEVYDPRANTWTRVRVLNTARAGHTAVRLDGPDCRRENPPKYCGAVVVSGGATTSADPKVINSPVVQATSEMYR